MNYCERVKTTEIRKYFKENYGLNASVEFRKDHFWIHVVNFRKDIDFKCLFWDYDVTSLGDLKSSGLNDLKFKWNNFLISKFGEEYKKAYHDHYFKNVDKDIFEKNTQEK